jgi:hypothetical protein
MKTILTVLALAGLFSISYGQQKSKKILPPDYSFAFRYYELLKDKDGFDSVRLWWSARRKKIFYNKGTIYHNHSKEYLRWRLSGENDSDIHHLNLLKKNTKDYAETIDGIRYYRFKDEKLGMSVAVYFPESNSWVIYRANPAPKSEDTTLTQK